MTKILIIEDDRTTRETLSDLLKMAGYAVTTAIDGQEGIEKLSATNPDVILLDFMMPRMNGEDFITCLNFTAFRKVPYVVMSAIPKHKVGNFFEHFVAKPFGVEELLGALERALLKEEVA